MSPKSVPGGGGGWGVSPRFCNHALTTARHYQHLYRGLGGEIQDGHGTHDETSSHTPEPGLYNNQAVK